MNSSNYIASGSFRRLRFFVLGAVLLCGAAFDIWTASYQKAVARDWGATPRPSGLGKGTVRPFQEQPQATLPPGFTETQISGLSNPTAMALHPDGRVFVSQQTGELRVIRGGALLAQPFVTLTVDSSGERGLLGVAFDPNFVVNNYVYVYYTATTPAIHNRVSRFTANGDVAVHASETIILELNNLVGERNHVAGAIHFGADGKLYIATGDNDNPPNSQTLDNLLGKMLRINSDGSIPPDNPFYNIATGDNRAIWTLGLRNPFTFEIQPGTGRIHINDVGAGTWEEVSKGLSGANYGWPICEGACGMTGFTDPIYQYANDGSTCAIAGGAFYNPANATFPIEYNGKYFFADLCAGWIKYLDPLNPPPAGTAPSFATGISSPVDIHVANDGSLYYLARGNGSVYRVQYCAPAGDYNATSTLGQSMVPGTTQVAGSVCNVCTVTIPLPFNYSLYGTSYSQVVASNSGTLQFTGNTANNSNTCLPAAAHTDTIFAYWDDLNTNINDNMGIFTSVSGSAPNRIFNIEWRAGYEAADAVANFEVRLYEGQTKYEVIYGNVTRRGFSATVGVQQGNGAVRRTQYACNTANSIQNGQKVTFNLGACPAGATAKP